jgi:hypothetical protein
MALSMFFVVTTVLVLICSLDLGMVSGLQSGMSGRSLFIKPPTDVTRKRPGGGGEYGIRQIDQKEVSKLVVDWTKKIRVPGGNRLEVYEMLRLLETVSLAMPGKAPQRNEFVAFASFVDGNIECVSALYLTKNSCPWEADVLLICQCPKLSVEKTHEMIEFIDEVCLDNACLPNYIPLEPHDVLMRQYRSYKRVKSSKLNKSGDSSSVIINSSNSPPYNLMNADYIDSYKELNKRRCICLEKFPANTHLGIHWYRVVVRHSENPQLRLPVYLRQKYDSPNEFHISFVRPERGVESGRGIVGGALVLDKTKAHTIVPIATAEVFTAISTELTARLRHPSLHSARDAPENDIAEETQENDGEEEASPEDTHISEDV